MSINENILEEIYRLESRLSKYHDHDLGLNFSDLDSANFDISNFLLVNFISSKGNQANDSEISTLNLEKIEKSLTLLHDVQKKSCEEIVLSIDKNLEKYIEISSKFEQMKGRLTETQSTFSVYNETVTEYSENVGNTLKSISKVVDSYSSIAKMEKTYMEIEKFLNIIQECNSQIDNVFQGTSYLKTLFSYFCSFF